MRRCIGGKPLPGVSLRVADDAQGLLGGRARPCGGKRPSVFSGYWRMPDKTAEELTADGWFKTGDGGRVNAKGYLTLIGRSKDLIISEGFNIYQARWRVL